MRWTLSLCLVAGLSQAQQEKPAVMALPLALKRAPAQTSAADKERLQREFNRQLKIAGALAPDVTRAEAASKLARQRNDCERDDACLVQIARKAEVLYGLVASLDLTVDNQVVLKGRIVRDDGEVVRAQVSVTRPLAQPRDFVELSRQLFTEFFKALSVGQLPATRSARTVPTAEAAPPVVIVTTPPPVAPPVEPPVVVAQPGPRRPLWGVVVAGGVVALAGLGLGAAGVALGSAPQRAGILLDPNDVPRVKTGSALLTGGLVGLAVGALTGLLGFVLAGPTEPAVSLIVMPGVGGALSWGGRW